MDKAYNPQATEDSIYQIWEDTGAFTADNQTDKETFTITMPPPNATGQLHLGHAVMLALEDIFIRYQRMQGKEALWVPGTDHAAIATENVVIQKLQKEGIQDPRAELGREKVLQHIMEFVDESQDTIRSQVRKMGSSCDWSREAYTMEPALHRCVNEVFKKMYDDGLIYRGHRIVNWDPNLQTGVSDDEVEYVEKTDPFYIFKYGEFEIGTVRPETKFGDKYVVVHPDDERYQQWNHGDTFEAEWINGPITATVIKDEAADPEMGSGAMTITPWHSHVDFEIAERHGLDKEQVIDFEGNLMEGAGEFAGMDIQDARAKIVAKLDAKGLVVKTEESYVHSVATNSRGGGVIEPQIREQWFIDVNKQVSTWKGDWAGKTMSLKEVMQDVVRSGKTQLIPERFDKIYFHWIDNLRDWCISRQIWWGHRIPVWYKGEESYCGVQEPEGDGWEQDPDTLDTWFSSALFTWSTLVDKEKALDHALSLEEILEQSPDYQTFHPTQVLETGYDIIFFWVARMILMTTYSVGQIPFETVYLHGLIRDRDGKKMSKSRPETCIDPLEIIPEYGADALRLSMIVGQSPGNDQRLYEEKIAGYRNFINKLWNASRFVLMQCDDKEFQCSSAPVLQSSHLPDNLSLADRALLSALQKLIDDVTDGLENYRLSEVGERLYAFTWDFFCDWYLELSKGEANHQVLIHTLRTLLILLHPYCPFVTEELWKQFKHEGDDILLKHSWPQSDSVLVDDAAEADLQKIIEVITAVRSLRSENGIDPAKQMKAIIHTDNVDLFESQRRHIEKLARLEELIIDDQPRHHDHAASAFFSGTELHLPLEGIIDLEAEKKKLTAEKQKLEGFIVGIEKKLSNPKFMDNAAEEIIEREKEKLAGNQEKLEKIEKRLASL